jgi:hypothetical membrane protein
VGAPAVVAAAIGAVQCWLGWLLAGSLWPGYDPIHQTISDLAANESPVKYLMSAFFLLGGTLSIVGAIWLRGLALLGRIAILVSGLSTYGLTIFPTPLIGFSTMHRVFAITAFVLSSAWPLLSMRSDRSFPALVRPLASVLVTLGLTILSVYFMSVWANQDVYNIGVVERVLVVTQSWYLVLVVFVLYRKQPKFVGQ